MHAAAPRPDPPAATSAAGGVVRTTIVAGSRLRTFGVPLLVIAAVLGALALVGRGATPDRVAAAATPASVAPTAGVSIAPGTAVESAARPARVAAPVAPAPTAPAFEPVAGPDALPPDPNDIATYFRPGDPIPTMRELIEALRESGVNDGIAAFNPPGTRPLLQGIVVPPDFPLPQGYVRHHQVTDQGEDVAPILMFAPDAQFVDHAGRPIALPENGVVPPELAPPGLPIVMVDVPNP